MSYKLTNYIDDNLNFVNEEIILPIEILKKGIIANESIEELDLSLNNFCTKESTLEALADIIVKNKKIRKINLDLNYIDYHKFEEKILKINNLESSNVLKKISLNLNYDNTNENDSPDFGILYNEIVFCNYKIEINNYRNFFSEFYKKFTTRIFL